MFVPKFNCRKSYTHPIDTIFTFPHGKLFRGHRLLADLKLSHASFALAFAVSGEQW